MKKRELDVYGNAARLFEAQSKDAYKRNQKCICEHEQTILVPTASLGIKRITLAQHGTVHLSTCKHSEMARTCWNEEKKPSTRQRASVEIPAEDV